MFITAPYRRAHALEYADVWWDRRNPLFSDYSAIGGDCTNFVSQCLFAGCCRMNFKKDVGWYYRSDADRSPSWTGVEFLYRFLLGNPDVGPYGEEVGLSSAELGDIIQLGRRDGTFYHSLLLTGYSKDGPLVTAHTNDVKNRPLSAYSFDAFRVIHIKWIRLETDSPDACFRQVLAGESTDAGTGGNDTGEITVSEEERKTLQLEPEMAPGEGFAEPVG